MSTTTREERLLRAVCQFSEICETQQHKIMELQERLKEAEDAAASNGTLEMRIQDLLGELQEVRLQNAALRTRYDSEL